MSLLIKNPWIVTMNDRYEILREGYVLVQGDSIAEVGNDPARMQELSRTADEIVEAGDKILLPGMVNAHTHMFQTFMRGLADDKPLFQWLREEIWPFSALMSEEDFHCAALVGSLDNLKTGATSVIDQHYIYTSRKNGDMVFEAMRESGIRGCLCRCFGNKEYDPRFIEQDDVILDEIRSSMRNTRKRERKLSISVGPINPWGVTAELFVKSKALSRERKIKYQVHTAETKAVVERASAMYNGLRNVEQFDSLGILDEDTQLVHSVWLSDNELRLYATRSRRSCIVLSPICTLRPASPVSPSFSNRGPTSRSLRTGRAATTARICSLRSNTPPACIRSIRLTRRCSTRATC
jgi:5-methylthioadenosine/S-adenosylhomocysteine deaminase